MSGPAPDTTDVRVGAPLHDALLALLPLLGVWDGTGIGAVESTGAQFRFGQHLVFAHDAPVPGAYVRLLDATGEFTAEVVTSATGDYRFFAAPGDWTVSVLHRDGKARKSVHALEPGLTEVPITLS